MSDAEHDQAPARPDERNRGAWPDPALPFGPTHWTNPAVYPRGPDGASPWSAADEPGGAPPVIADGPQARPGWLTRGREAGGPDPAA